MSKWGRKRDDNEPSIVAALRKVGATVTTLDHTGVPDLLVGFRGKTYLLEVKQRHGQPGVGMKLSKSGLLPSQESWWANWKGCQPIVVTTADEALKAIGAV